TTLTPGYRYRCDATVLPVSHRGHGKYCAGTGGKPTRRNVFELPDQIVHAMAIFDRIYEIAGASTASSNSSAAKTRPRMLLCGHSIGAYIAQE
ncbi:hypothetical protein EV182_008140, partial [Spiromyces aspiralis]